MTVVGGKIVSFANGGVTLQPPHIVNGPYAPPSSGMVATPPHTPPIHVSPPTRGLVATPPHTPPILHVPPPPVDAYTVSGATAQPPHLASLGQAFSFAQANFPAGDGTVTITRKQLRVA